MRRVGGWRWIDVILFEFPWWELVGDLLVVLISLDEWERKIHLIFNSFRS